MSLVIYVNGLNKFYKTYHAVNNLSFEVKEGEIFGLLGRNGAGKTTTLEILETLLEKSSGEVFINNFNIDNQSNSIKKYIGVQLQAAGYYPNLTLVELIQLFAGLYNCTTDPMALLAKFDLVDKAHQRYKTLSGGQKQRFSIATTLIHQPRVIFLDEPSTGLDPQARRSLWNLIKQIRDEGCTIVLTTHYMDEAEVLCDRVAVMEKGSIVAMGSPDALIDNLLAKGFTKPVPPKNATLEDVFIDLTGAYLS